MFTTVGASESIVYSFIFPSAKEPQTGLLTLLGNYINGVSTIPVFGLRFRPGNVAGMFGFAANSVNMAQGGVLRSTQIIQLSSNPFLILRSTLVLGEILQPIAGSGAVEHFGWIGYAWSWDVALSSKVLAHTGHTSYRFWLTDASADANLIDLNGLPITLVLVFYKHENLSQLQRQTILLQHLKQLSTNPHPIVL